ncbi:MAG: hypothetical protein JXR68_04095 [Bacteroidales bacterium]|nr:hypothetical protein [Bacteroidales bacterium]
MKSAKLAFIALFVIVLSLASCKKSDTDLLVGLWQGYEVSYNDTVSDWNDLFKTITFRIEEDGTGYISFLGENDDFTWTYNEDTKVLTTTDSTDVTSATITLIDENSLWYEYQDEGDKVIEKWNRVEE